MKKVFALMFAAGMLAFVACGEGKKEDKTADSLKKDSLMKDSIAKAEAATKLADSLKADSIAKADSAAKKEEKKK